MTREESLSILNPYIFIFISQVLHCTELPNQEHSPQAIPTVPLQNGEVIPAQDCQAPRFAAQGKKVEVAGQE